MLQKKLMTMVYS